MNNIGYWDKLIIDFPQTEENKELFASTIDWEQEEDRLKKQATRDNGYYGVESDTVITKVREN